MTDITHVLPTEMQDGIFLRLDSATLPIAARICAKWRHMIQEDGFPRRWCEQHEKSPALLPKLQGLSSPMQCQIIDPPLDPEYGADSDVIKNNSVQSRIFFTRGQEIGHFGFVISTCALLWGAWNLSISEGVGAVFGTGRISNLLCQGGAFGGAIFALYRNLGDSKGRFANFLAAQKRLPLVEINRECWQETIAQYSGVALASVATIPVLLMVLIFPHKEWFEFSPLLLSPALFSFIVSAGCLYVPDRLVGRIQTKRAGARKLDEVQKDYRQVNTLERRWGILPTAEQNALALALQRATKEVGANPSIGSAERAQLLGAFQELYQSGFAKPQGVES